MHIIIILSSSSQKLKREVLSTHVQFHFMAKEKSNIYGEGTSRRARLTLFFSSIDRERFIVVNLSLPDLDLVYL